MIHVAMGCKIHAVSTLAVKSMHDYLHMKQLGSPINCMSAGFSRHLILCSMDGGIFHGGLKVVASDDEVFRHNSEIEIICSGSGKASDTEQMLRYSGYSVVANSEVVRDSKTASAIWSTLTKYSAAKAKLARRVDVCFTRWSRTSCALDFDPL
jgi:hypothetical protein